MPRARLPPLLALATAAALALAGCAKEEAPAQTNAIAPGILEGVVTDAAFLALAGVNVTVEGANASALTDAAGVFRFELLPGEYVVLASHGDHKTGALRASVLSDQTSSLAFQLDPIPRLLPRIDVAQSEGYLACAALLEASGARHPLPCGERDPNDRPEVEFGIPTTDGLETAVVELAWDAGTAGARMLRIEVELVVADSIAALGATEGASPLALPIPGRLLGAGTLVVRASPAGSFADEEAGSDAGWVLQQPFTAYASLFYHAPATSGYSAIQEG